MINLRGTHDRLTIEVCQLEIYGNKKGERKMRNLTAITEYKIPQSIPKINI